MSKKSEELDKLGNYMKEFEKVETSRKCPLGKPLIVRLDGRAFHSFTQGLTRPFDNGLSELMRQTTLMLVKELHALVGYTQSDEITLIWYIPENSESQYLFGGRYQKIATIAAATATAFFNKNLSEFVPKKAHLVPVFDGRAFSVNTLHDAYLCLFWRQTDAIKNSITMTALSHFSHKKLQGVGSSKKLQMLREIGVYWEQYPEKFQRGSFFARVTAEVAFTPEELERIPEKYRPTEPVMRSFVKEVHPELKSEKVTDAEIESFFKKWFTF